MGRPKKENRRTIRKPLNFTKEEWSYLEDLNQKTTLRMNDMIYEMLFKGQVRIVQETKSKTKADLILISEVNAIGRNFNQLMKAINSKNTAYFSTKEKNMLLDNLSEIKKYFSLINKRLE